jgi:rod shape-determining protein MreD
MQNIKILVNLLLVTFIILILQNTIFSLKFFANIKPELFTLLIVNYAFFEKNKLRGYIFSSFVGFSEDILTNQIFGVNIFLKSSVFLIVFLLKEKMFSNTFFLKCLSGVVLNQLEFWVIYFLTSIFSVSMFSPFKDNFLHYTLFYIFITPVFLYFINKIENKFFAKYEG